MDIIIIKLLLFLGFLGFLGFLRLNYKVYNFIIILFLGLNYKVITISRISKIKL
jgi:hypothetical protein